MFQPTMKAAAVLRSCFFDGSILFVLIATGEVNLGVHCAKILWCPKTLKCYRHRHRSSPSRVWVLNPWDWKPGGRVNCKQEGHRQCSSPPIWRFPPLGPLLVFRKLFRIWFLPKTRYFFIFLVNVSLFSTSVLWYNGSLVVFGVGNCIRFPYKKQFKQVNPSSDSNDATIIPADLTRDELSLSKNSQRSQMTANNPIMNNVDKSGSGEFDLDDISERCNSGVPSSIDSEAGNVLSNSQRQLPSNTILGNPNLGGLPNVQHLNNPFKPLSTHNLSVGTVTPFGMGAARVSSKGNAVAQLLGQGLPSTDLSSDFENQQPVLPASTPVLFRNNSFRESSESKMQDFRNSITQIIAQNSGSTPSVTPVVMSTPNITSSFSTASLKPSANAMWAATTAATNAIKQTASNSAIHSARNHKSGRGENPAILDDFKNLISENWGLKCEGEETPEDSCETGLAQQSENTVNLHSRSNSLNGVNSRSNSVNTNGRDHFPTVNTASFGTLPKLDVSSTTSTPLTAQPLTTTEDMALDTRIQREVDTVKTLVRELSKFDAGTEDCEEPVVFIDTFD